MLARLVRYFHQSPDYWLDHCTLHDWQTIWCPNLIKTPPIDYWGAVYFKYEPPADATTAPEPDDEGEWESPFPDVTE